MQQAYDNIKSIYPAESALLTVRPTHQYLKIPIADSLEFEILEAYETEHVLNFFQYPLDYEIISYPDGDYGEEIYLPRYTSLEVGALALDSFPLPYEVLADLYLPDTDRGTQLLNTFDDFLDALEEEAFKITNNDTPEEAKVSGFTPSGYIKFYNIVSGAYEGTPNVEVRTRRWFTYHSDFTDNNGYYYIPKTYKNKVHYSVKYKNDEARINAWAVGTYTAVLEGPKQEGPWSHNAPQGTKAYLWGAIMRGVYDYHNHLVPTYNIGPPPNHLKIRACPESDCGVNTMLNTTFSSPPLVLTPFVFGEWLTNDIKIGNKHDEFNSLYKTTIHELGHAAHWNLVGSFTISANWTMIWSHKLVREAWATGITDVGYQDKFGVSYYKDCLDGGIQDMIEDGYARVLVRDLMDRENEFDPDRDPNCDVDDLVMGFNLQQIFEALVGVGSTSNNNSMGKWRDNLKEEIPAQSANLDHYFLQWEL